jgi:hypothetical protein
MINPLLTLSKLEAPFPGSCDITTYRSDSTGKGERKAATVAGH